MTMFATPARPSIRITLTGAALLMTTALTTTALTTTAMAQTTPDAGQVLRDNKAPLTAPVTQARPTLSIPDEADTAADTGQKVVIDAIRIDGAYSLS